MATAWKPPYFHSSVEGAQYGGLTLEEFLDFCKECGAKGAQPSNFHLQGKGGFRAASDILGAFEERELRFDGVSCHCPTWVHGAAWTGTKSVRPFIPPDVARMDPAEIEAWALEYLQQLFPLCADLGIKAVAMFWGPLYGLEVATGYPWGFWEFSPTEEDDQDLAYNLIAEGDERAKKLILSVVEAARGSNLKLCHEIHPGTAAMTAADFWRLVNDVIEDSEEDPVLLVNGDPSHCWENERWEGRTRAVAELIYMSHVKNHYVKPGHPLRCMIPGWPERPMQFTFLHDGDINLLRYAELLIETGYPERFRELYGLDEDDTVPLGVEAEGAFAQKEWVTMRGVEYVNKELCFPRASGSFQDDMGQK